MAPRNRRGRNHDHHGAEGPVSRAGSFGPLFDDELTANGNVAPPRQRAPEDFLDSHPAAPGSATSAAHAERMAPRMRSKNFLIEEHVRSCGKHGATRQDIADATGILLQTVCAGVNALVKAGRLASNGEVRESREVLVSEEFVWRWIGGRDNASED